MRSGKGYKNSYMMKIKKSPVYNYNHLSPTIYPQVDGRRFLHIPRKKTAEDYPPRAVRCLPICIGFPAYHNHTYPRLFISIQTRSLYYPHV